MTRKPIFMQMSSCKSTKEQREQVPGKTTEMIWYRVYFVIVLDLIERVGAHLEASSMTAVEGSIQRTVRLLIYLLIPQVFIECQSPGHSTKYQRCQE